MLFALANPSLAVGPQGQATQINIYGDSKCGPFIAPIMNYYGKSPKLNDCFELNLPSNTQSLNLVGAWDKETSASPGGHCTVYSDFGCTGKQDIKETVWPSGGPGCLNSRGSSGFLWKSARCYVYRT